MRNAIAKLFVGQIRDLKSQTKLEAWVNGPGLVVSKIIFWIIIFMSITLEIRCQCTAQGIGSFSWFGSSEGTATTWNLNDPITGYAPINCGGNFQIDAIFSDPNGIRLIGSDGTSNQGGVYGPGFLTLANDALFPGDFTTLTYIFLESIPLSNWRVDDIDGNAGFQDKVVFLAYDDNNSSVTVTLVPVIPSTSELLVTGNTVTANSDEAIVVPDDANGQVYVSTSQPIKRLVMQYTAGPDISNPSAQYIRMPGFTVSACCIDSDEDGIGDLLDIDDDNDGITDTQESCGTDPLEIINSPINISINLDNYPSETTWWVSGPSGIVGSGGPYNLPNTTVFATVEVDENGPYEFVITDSYGDGLSGNTYSVSGNDFSPMSAPFHDQGAVGRPVSLYTNFDISSACQSAFTCLSADPILDNDKDGTLNYQDADFCTLNANGVCTHLDTDGDGIIDMLDLDSDNDGCFDAEEAGHNEYMAPDNSIVIDPAEVGMNGLADRVENSDLIVTSLSYPLSTTDTGVFNFQNNAAFFACSASEESDADGDGIVDAEDLDDDNDGILDETENVCQRAQIEWSHNGDNGQSQSATYTPNSEVYFTSAQDAIFGWGLDENSDNYAYTYLLRNADAATYSEAKTNNDYVELSFVPLETVRLEAINLGFWSNSQWDPEFNIGNFKMAIEYSYERGFVNPTLLFQDIQVGDMIAGGYVFLPQDLSSEDILLEGGTSYAFRFYFYDEQNSDWANRVRFDDVQFPVTPLSTCDTDGDGLADYVDTDSDGDGCPDALEGTGAFIYEDIASDTLTGGIDENGVPLVATATGQGLGSAQESAALGLACITLAENDINQTPFDTDVSGNLLTNDTDPTKDNQWIQSIYALNDQGIMMPLQIGGRSTDIYDEDGSFAGTISIYSDGSYDFNPASTYSGMVSLSYLVEDTNGATDAATLTIKVIPINNPRTNQAPIANDDTNTTEMDIDVAGNVITSNDHDLEGDVLTITTGLADINGEGIVDEPLSIGTAAVINGLNFIGDPVMAGTIILQTDGNYSFDPIAEFSGKISIEYTITDGNGGEDDAILTILVLPNLSNQSFAHDEVSTGKVDKTQTGNIMTNDHDPELDQQIVTAAADNNGVALVIDGTTENELRSGTVVLDSEGSFIYTPGAGFIGTEAVVYVLCDDVRPESACDTATLYFTTLPFNNLVATDDFNNTPFETPLIANVSTNDIDEENDQLTFSLTSANGGMHLDTGDVIMEVDGSYTYHPGSNFSGPTQFEYQVCDDGQPAMCDTSMVYLKVFPAISAETIQLVANPDAHTMETGQTGTGNVMINDLDPDDLDPAVITTVDDTPVEGIDENGNTFFPAGTISLISDGSYVFIPAAGFTGMVIQPYTICNAVAPAVCDNTELMIKVIPDIENTTFANDDAVITDAGVVVTGNILANDNDSEMDNQLVSEFLIDRDGDGTGDTSGALGRPSVVSGFDDAGDFVADAGQFTLNLDGSFSLTPNSGFMGNLNIPYTICDDVVDDMACADATLVISVLNVQRDYGDGPTAYPTCWHRAVTDADGDHELDGATDVWLGMKTSFESASTDTNIGDQFDDAISFGSNPGQFPLFAEPGQSYDVNITVNSSQVDMVFYGMWIDWNEDGVYDDFYTGSQETASPAIATTTITAPAATTGLINVRLRADDNPFVASDFAGGKTNGEVEDFQAMVVLPVELTQFTGRPNGCLVDLQWHTESEENFSHFELERSDNGRDFEKIAEITGTGGAGIPYSYNYLDKNATAQNYYRLKMIDLDGTFDLSKVISVKTDCENMEAIILYPNPRIVGDGLLNLRFNATSEKAHIQIADIYGRVVRRLIIETAINQENTLQMEVSDLIEGSYYLQLIDGTIEYSKTFILINED